MAADTEKKKKRHKATVHEMQQRVNQVQQWICEGKPRRTIIRLCSETWGIECDRSVDLLMKRAREAWVEELNNIDRREMVSEIAGKFAHIYEQACATRQYAVAHASQTALMKIMALDRGAF